MHSLTDQLKCAKREAALRKNVYPKWIASGRLRPDKAQYEIECMESICATLQKALDLEQISQEMRQKPVGMEQTAPEPEQDL